MDQENVGKGGRAQQEVSGWDGKNIYIYMQFVDDDAQNKKKREKERRGKKSRVRENFLLIMPIYAALRGENKKKKTIASTRKTSH